ncbi:MAG: flagellar biosynthesis protein FlhB [Oscillospiraceae bacterium]|nr:flagellar biosynthesis protein FlhB [Oscillospiraceae bacterium]
MATGAGQEKTEKATPKKRRDAREKEGNILQSKEVNTAFSLLGIFLALSVLASFMYLQLQEAIKFFLGNIGTHEPVTVTVITVTATQVLRFIVSIVGPILLVALLVGVLPTIYQSKGLFTMKPLRPKFSKLNPITGAKRLFSIQSFVNVIKGLVTIAIICGIVYNKITGLLPEIRQMPQRELQQGVLFIAKNVFSTIILIIIVFAFIAAGDYVFQWWQYEKKLKMSKQEVKDEYKQIEGDPLIKSKIKQKQREIAQSRMMQEVPDSDVVVRNPTHFAVALRYDPGIMFSAPKVVAKGQDEIALKIIKIAEENNVPITEDRPLARALHDGVKLGSDIPHTLFTAVAAIFAELESVKGRINIDI